MSTRWDGKQGPGDSQRLLSRLLMIEWYSLARYLMAASPWVGVEEEASLDILRRIAQDQQNNGVRIGRLLVRRHGYAESGQFPVEFVEYNDLALGYVIQRLIDHERRMIDDITRCVKQLAGDAEGKQLVQEILVNEKLHLDLLTHLPLPGFHPTSTSPLEVVTETSPAVPGSNPPAWAHPVALSPFNGIPPQAVRPGDLNGRF